MIEFIYPIISAPIIYFLFKNFVFRNPKTVYIAGKKFEYLLRQQHQMAMMDFVDLPVALQHKFITELKCDVKTISLYALWWKEMPEWKPNPW